MIRLWRRWHTLRGHYVYVYDEGRGGWGYVCATCQYRRAVELGDYA